MSCPHGNHIQGCDICDEVNAAYKSGYEEGGKTSIDLTMKHLRRAELAESKLANVMQWLRETYEIYAGMEGIPLPKLASEAYLLRVIEQMQKSVSELIRSVEGK